MVCLACRGKNKLPNSVEGMSIYKRNHKGQKRILNVRKFSFGESSAILK